jgi:hypothetical protein
MLCPWLGHWNSEIFGFWQKLICVLVLRTEHIYTVPGTRYWYSKPVNGNFDETSNTPGTGTCTRPARVDIYFIGKKTDIFPIYNFAELRTCAQFAAWPELHPHRHTATAPHRTTQHRTRPVPYPYPSRPGARPGIMKGDTCTVHTYKLYPVPGTVLILCI